MVIPKILPLQFMSEKVKKKEGEYGDFRDTLSNEKFGDLATPFEIIPIVCQKKWLEFNLVPKKGGGFTREYRGAIPIQDNPMAPNYNDELPLKEEGVERDRVVDCFILIPSEVAAGGELPYVVSFRRTSLKAGQKLLTQMYVKNQAARRVPAATVMLLSGFSKQNDDGEFVVQDVAPKREATMKELEAAFKWFKIITDAKTNVTVDESEFKEPAPMKRDAINETEF